MLRSGLFALLLVPAFVHAQGVPPGAAKPGDPKRVQRFKTLQDEIAKAGREFLEALREAGDDAEARKDALKKQPNLSDYGPRFLELATENPTDEVAFEVLAFLALEVPSRQSEAMRLLAQHHANNPRVGPLVLTLAHNPRGERFARSLLEGTRNSAVRGFARYALADTLYRQEELRRPRPNAAPLPSNRAEVEKLLEQVRAETARVRLPAGGRELGDLARAYLFEMHDLAVGRPAPAAVGTDLDGKKQALADFRGQVVVLNFWAISSRVSHAVIPEGQALTQRLSGKPFAYVCVSGDNDPRGFKRVAREQSFPGTQWIAGTGPGLVQEWNVRYFPTTYVIDAKGVIRHKNIRGPQLAEAVDKLLAEMEK